MGGTGSSSMSSYDQSYAKPPLQTSASLQTQRSDDGSHEPYGSADVRPVQNASASNRDALKSPRPQQHEDNAYCIYGSAAVSQPQDPSSSNSDQRIFETNLPSSNETRDPEGDTDTGRNNREHPTRTFTEMLEDSDVEVDDAV